ncbi:hypothetical protein IVB46_00865 [Bradyrhizobium sp. 61]|uniref:hypothetical protein n=1 Tax=unclassified Bradyrhizobium TaxID=2631580 RepID=UPI001FF96541|nr:MULTISPECIES: hypothetical protein [unclassified Bradyrhizobium]MCK1273794.1 hypothetical protein [Bradyrhizobium sp. 61]MCK1447994.1 hypothetical protein [Bradyrhizobium sp. 48]
MTDFLLTHNETMLTRKALGLEHGNSVNRNRVAVHDTGYDIATAQRLVGKGYMVATPDRDFGSMRVFAVTAAGAKAIGKKLPPAHVVLPIAA